MTAPVVPIVDLQVGGHTWEKMPDACLIAGYRFTHFRCRDCQFSYVTRDENTPKRWGFPGTGFVLWDGVATCESIVTARRELQEKERAAIEAAQEAERLRIEAGGAPGPSQHERIQLAIDAANKRGGNPGVKR